MKVLVVAHGHPSIHKGGGEVAAYSLYQMLKDIGHQAVFLGHTILMVMARHAIG